MIVVKFDGMLGNNLFQYAFCRLLAERMGLELGYEVVSKLTVYGGGYCTIDALTDYFPNAPLSVPGKRIMEPEEMISTHHIIDVDDIVKNKTNRRLFIHGFFQRMDYYEPHKDKIKKWFKMKDVVRPPYAKNDIVLVIRKGSDFSPWELPLCYYDQAINSLSNVGRVYACGVNIDEKVKNHLSKYKPIYFNGSPIESFQFIGFFNRIIIPNSTFAWWAAYLSDAKEIVAPRSHDYFGCYGFTGFKEVDLHMRESRYKEFIIDLDKCKETV